MPEYEYDEAFEHRLARVLREIGNEAVQPFDPYETTQIAISRSRIGVVPITQIPMEQLRAQQMSQPVPQVAPPNVAPPNVPPPGPPPGYYDDEPLPAEPRRWPLLAALGLLIAALLFAGIATGYIKLPSNFGITFGSPAPTQSSSPIVTSGPTAAPSPTPKRTKKPRRTPRPQQTEAPVVTTQPEPTDAPTQQPTDEPTPEQPEQTPEPPESEPTQDVDATPL